MPDYNGALHIRKSMAFCYFVTLKGQYAQAILNALCNFTISLQGLNGIFVPS